MADTGSLFSFFADAPPGSPLSYDALDARRKIAIALASREQPFPTTVGAGLAALGDAFGQRRNLAALDAQSAQQAAAERDYLKGAPSDIYVPGIETQTPSVAGPTPSPAPPPQRAADVTPPAFAAPPPPSEAAPAPLPDIAPPPVTAEGDAPMSQSALDAGATQGEVNTARSKLAQMLVKRSLLSPETAGGNAPVPFTPPSVNDQIAEQGAPRLTAAAGDQAALPPDAGNPPIPTAIPRAPPPGPTPSPLPPDARGPMPPLTGPAAPADIAQQPIQAPRPQVMAPPGPPPEPPRLLGPSQGMAYWSQVMNNPRFSPDARAQAKQQYELADAGRKTLQERQQNEYMNNRGQWEKADEKYKDFVRTADDRTLKNQIDVIGAANTQATLEKALYEQGKPREQAAAEADLKIRQLQQQIATPQKVEQVAGRIVAFNPNTGQFEDRTPPLDPSKIKLSDVEAKKVEFYTRAQNASQYLGDASELANRTDVIKHALPGGNAYVSQAFQSKFNAANAWMVAVLRDESGAVLNKDEIAQKYGTYFPVPGDSAATIRQKTQLRANEEKSFYDTLGPARGIVPAPPPPMDSAARPAVPAGVADGTIQTNPRTGAMRRAVGGHWEDVRGQ
jgi:hypothetical protein